MLLIGGSLATPSASASVGTWSSVASLNYSRPVLGDAAALGPDGRIYVAGGNSNDATAADTTEAYAPSTGQWTVLPTMPTSQSAAAVAAAGGKVFVIGGYDPTAGFETGNVEAYDPTTNSWATEANLPTARDFMAAVTASDGRIYAIGGHENYGTYFATVEVYDPGTNSWSTGTSLPQPRSAPAAVALGNSVYLFGGFNLTDGDLASSLRYDLSDQTWHSIAAMPDALSGASAAVGADGRVYVVGGNANGTAVDTVQIYDPVTDSWTLGPPLEIARLWNGAASDEAGNVYAIAGESSGGAQADPSQSVERLPVHADAPTITSLSRAFALKSQLGVAQPTPVPVLIQWAASSNSGQGVCSYQLAEELNGGAYTPVQLSSPTQTKVLVKLLAGTATAPNAYGFRLTAIDCDGASAVRSLAPFQVQAIAENDTRVSYSSGWKRLLDSSAVGRYVERSSTTNASATLTTTASDLALVAPTGPTYGSAKIYVDGVLKTTVNLHTATSKKARQEIFRIGFRTAGSHTLKVVVVGTAGHPTVDIDAFATLA